jgi:hypothetical protein
MMHRPPTTDHSTTAADNKALLDAAAAYVPPVADKVVTTEVVPPTSETSQSNATAQHGILFVDGRIPDYQTVMAAATPGTEVVMLDPNRDGVTQMAAVLQGRSDIDSISIVSHGDAGVLLLGDVGLSTSNLDKYTSELQTIGQSLSAKGDILLYGCDVGLGQTGHTFIEALATATGAKVAASTNDTGAARLGGDWNLEIATGTLEAPPVLDIQKLSSYEYLLATDSVK